MTDDLLATIRRAHGGWVEAGGPHGNSERWIGVLLGIIGERDTEIEALKALIETQEVCIRERGGRIGERGAMKIEELAQLVQRKRGSMGIRAAAKEIGISPTTLSRVERGHVPDLKTLEKICAWIGEYPAKFTGIGGLQIAFKKKTAVSQDTAKSLANLIQLASEQIREAVEAANPRIEVECGPPLPSNSTSE